jgi:hypothetical protein
MLGYLDPATGSMLLQAAVGAIAAVAVAMRLWWGRLKQMLGFSRPPRPEATEDVQ